MPVAYYKPMRGGYVGPRNFHAPKESSLKGWWNAARKAIPELPLWRDINGGRYEGSYDEEAIHFKVDVGELWISRKRNLR